MYFLTNLINHTTLPNTFVHKKKNQFSFDIIMVGVIFNWVLQIIQDFFSFTLPSGCSKNLCHSLKQSDAKLKPITIWLLASYSTLGNLVRFTFSSHWLIKVISFLLFGFCNIFGLGLTAPNQKALFSYPGIANNLVRKTIIKFFILMPKNEHIVHRPRV